MCTAAAHRKALPVAGEVNLAEATLNFTARIMNAAQFADDCLTSSVCLEGQVSKDRDIKSVVLAEGHMM